VSTGPDFQKIIRELLAEQQPPPPDEPIDERALDAALTLIAEYGERRFTMDDIAAASKVARATLFRRFGSKDALVQRVYERELRRTLERFHTDTVGAEDRLVAGFVSLTTFACGHPVIQRLARAEPDVMVGLWRDGDLPGIDLIRTLFASVAGKNQAGLCDGLARLMFSFTMIPEGVPSERELAAVVRRLEQFEWEGVRHESGGQGKQWGLSHSL
jgi:AcrR family transcriptional regulator